MFWSLFLGNTTREPASVVCDDEQDDLFYSMGPHGNRCQPQLTQEKLRRSLGEKNASEWTVRVEIRKEKISSSNSSTYTDLLWS